MRMLSSLNLMRSANLTYQLNVPASALGNMSKYYTTSWICGNRAWITPIYRNAPCNIPKHFVFSTICCAHSSKFLDGNASGAMLEPSGMQVTTGMPSSSSIRKHEGSSSWQNMTPCPFPEQMTVNPSSSSSSQVLIGLYAISSQEPASFVCACRCIGIWTRDRLAIRNILCGADGCTLGKLERAAPIPFSTHGSDREPIARMSAKELNVDILDGISPIISTEFVHRRNPFTWRNYE